MYRIFRRTFKRIPRSIPVLYWSKVPVSGGRTARGCQAKIICRRLDGRIQLAVDRLQHLVVTRNLRIRLPTHRHHSGCPGPGLSDVGCGGATSLLSPCHFCP